MPQSILSGSVGSSKMEVIVDLGNPFLNVTVDGFLKIGSVAATKVAADEAYAAVKRGSFSKKDFQNALKKMCTEGVYWGTVGGVYAGVEYGIEKIRGTRDWKNATLSGAATGALISIATNNSRDKIVTDAITGGAVATAAAFLSGLA